MCGIKGPLQSKLFNGTLLADHDENGRIVKGTARKFDLRTEIGMLEEVGRPFPF